MATETRKIEWLLSARNTGNSAFDEVKRSMSELEARGNSLVKTLSGLSVLGRFGAALAAATGIGQIVRETADAERTMNRLNAALKSTGDSAGLTSNELEELAGTLKNASVFDDDQIKKGITALLRFREVQGDTFREGSRLAVDLAAALDIDIVSAFERIGKALQDPETGMKGLRAAGIKLSESQIELAGRLNRTGEFAAAQKIVLDALSKSIGGTAAAENSGLYGGSKRAGIAYDDLLKTIGKTAVVQSAAKSFFEFTTQSLKDIETIINKGDWVEKLLALGAFSAGFRGIKLSEPAPAEGDRVEGARPIKGAVPPELQKRIGALQAIIDREGELAKKRNDIAVKGTIELNKAAAEAQLNVEKDLGKQRQQVLETYYSAGLVSTADYYNRRVTLAQESTRAEIRQIDLQIAEQSKTKAIAQEKVEPEKVIEAEKELLRLSGERRRLQVQSGGEIATLRLKEIQDNEKLLDVAREINVQLQEQQGNTVSAANARFNAENRKKSESIDRNLADPNTSRDTRAELERAKAQLPVLRDLVVANAQFTDAREEQELLVNRLQIGEDRLQNSLRVGAIGEIEALSRTSALRKAYIATIEEQVVKLEELARTTLGEDGQPIKKLVVQAEQARAALEKLRGESNLLADKFNTIFNDSFGDAFSDFISGTKSAKEAFTSFANSVVQQINKLVAQDLAKSIFGGGSAGGGIGGFFAQIFRPSGSSNGVYGPTPSGGNIAGGGFFDWLAGLFKADGGPVSANSPYIVGERGPELFMPRTAGTVVPAGQWSGGATIINISQNFHGPQDRRSIDQAALETGFQVQRALARNG